MTSRSGSASECSTLEATHSLLGHAWYQGSLNGRGMMIGACFFVSTLLVFQRKRKRVHRTATAGFLVRVSSKSCHRRSRSQCGLKMVSPL